MSTLTNGKKLIKLMADKGFKVRALNIVYLRGADTDTWEPIENTPDLWNDVRCVVRNTGEVILSNLATVEPGRYYTRYPMNPDGAFRIAADYQHLDGWCLGQHFGRPALEQVGQLFGYRDGNKNAQSEKPEAQYIPSESKVNQHGCNGKDAALYSIDHWSAGCLVGAYWASHMKFYEVCKSMGLDTFDTTVFIGTTYAKYEPQ